MSLKNILLSFLMLSFSTCSIIQTEVSGSQKIQIRIWRDNTPDLLDLTGILNLDVANENVLEYDMEIVGSTIYFAYTTDKRVYTAQRPQGGWGEVDTPDEFNDPNTDAPPIAMVKYQEITTGSKTTTIALNNLNQEINRFDTPVNNDGVWLRFFKGVISGSESTTTIVWESLIQTDQVMKISDLSVLPLKNQEATLVAVSNQSTVIVFNDSDRNGTLNFLYSDLLHQNFSKVDQLNSWQMGEETFLAMIADNRILITGFFRNSAWNSVATYGQNFDIKNFQVQVGQNFPYAVWVNPQAQKMSLLAYHASGNLTSRWLEIDTLSAVKNPKLSIKLYRDENNIQHEDIYVGTVNEQRNFFQLFEVRDLQLYFLGPIITEWNESYSFAGNELGQVLYVRSNFDQQLIFAGLNSLQKWEQIQRNSPPPEIIQPSSTLETVFINNSYSLTIYKRRNGAIYFLAGVR